MTGKPRYELRQAKTRGFDLIPRGARAFQGISVDGRLAVYEVW